MNGIICINKPEQWTSFDVVAKSRGIAKTRKVGHAGTLDPMATGVLPLFFGAATKLCDLLPDEQKGYVAEFRLGITTDTLDRTGTVQSETVSVVKKEQLEGALSPFRGDILQIPPMYSAVQIDGQRLYDLARKGKEVERKPRPVTIYKLTLCAFDERTQTGKLSVLCSKGTYIRSLVADLGEVLGVGGMLTALVRDQAGPFTLADCYTLEELSALAVEGGLSSIVKPIDTVFVHYPKIVLNAVQTPKFCNGIKLDLARISFAGMAQVHTVYDEGGLFLGLARPDLEAQSLRLVKSFWQAGKE